MHNQIESEGTPKDFHEIPFCDIKGGLPLDNQPIQVPVSVLLAPDATASAKVVWMAVRLHPGAGPAELEAYTGLCRHTVLRGLSQVTACNRSAGGARVKVPVALLAERAVGAQAKVLYGLLQTTPNFRGQSGRFTYAALSGLTGLTPNTLRRAMADLSAGKWVRLAQANRVSPINFTLDSPAQAHRRDETNAAELRLKLSKFSGEAIMQEYLSLLIDSDQFTDNARPGFLVNPLTGQRMELDRFYPQAQVAFEFHGAQHDRATKKFSQEQVDAQRLRDLLKAGICLYAEIHLVIIRAADLSLQGMIKRIGRSMPLRDLAGYDRLIDLLEEASICYKAEAEAAEKAGA